MRHGSERAIGSRVAATAVAFAGLAALAGAAWAGMGQPTDGQIGLQLPASLVAEEINSFYNYVNYILIAITLFVVALMAYVVIKFNARASQTPSTVTHNTTVEFVWTVVPILILIAIGIPSFKLLYLQYEYPKPEVVIKSVGNAWFWEHEYPDEDGLTVTQNMIRDDEVIEDAIGKEKFKQTYGDLEGTELSRVLFRDAQQYWAQRPMPRQLLVDNPIAVPVGKVVHVLITSNDVIHGWAVPALGSRVQAVPGRTTATWFKATKTGAFYGQCAVLCGQYHASMPIGIHVVEEPVYTRWLAAQKAGDDGLAKTILYDAMATSDAKKIADGASGTLDVKQVAAVRDAAPAK